MVQFKVKINLMGCAHIPVLNWSGAYYYRNEFYRHRDVPADQLMQLRLLARDSTRTDVWKGRYKDDIPRVILCIRMAS
jgi:hypothetical protein